MVSQAPRPRFESAEPEIGRPATSSMSEGPVSHVLLDDVLLYVPGLVDGRPTIVEDEYGQFL
jgi:hypothetical protein